MTKAMISPTLSDLQTNSCVISEALRIYYFQRFLFEPRGSHEDVFGCEFSRNLPRHTTKTPHSRSPNTPPLADCSAFTAVVANILIWSRIEPCCSVVAACLPTLGPLVRSGRDPGSLVNSIRSIFSVHSSISLGSLRARRSPKHASKASENASDAPPEDGVDPDHRWNWVRLEGASKDPSTVEDRNCPTEV
ncbi:MAG: hypothetical protein Q9160_004912 [Pyrenula sp. 1 TL-2023]